jgi:GT2 family glycosyltransferase
VEAAVSSIISKSDFQNFEILILDNASLDSDILEYFDQIQNREARVRVVPYHHPFNYSAINNFGVGQARGELIALVNNDLEVISEEWLSEMVSHALRPEIGCVGAKLYYPSDTIQHGGVIVGLGGLAAHSHSHFQRKDSGYFHRLNCVQNLSAVTAACLVMRKCVFEQVGGFDEKNLTIAFNDVDLCLKVREAGYRNLWTPYAELYHHESLSRGYEDSPEKIKRFQSEIAFMKKKWGRGGNLSVDPYYNPNLTLDREDFSLR